MKRALAPLLLLLLPAIARAEPAVPPLRVVATNLLALRYNPLGLEDQLRLGWQMRLYAREAPALRDNYVFFGLAPKLSPAYAKVGPSLEVAPLSVFSLRTTVELVDFFSTFGHLQSFGSPRDDYADSTLSRRNDAGLSYSTDGVHFLLEPMLQLKVKSFVVRNRFSVEYWRMRTHPGETVFYEPTLDTLVPANGWVLANDLDLLYLTRFRLVVGLRYSTVQPLYRDADFRPGEPHEANNGYHRLGPLIAYTFFERPYARFSRPTLILITNWYASHRYRTGADVNAGIPYLALAFFFASDLVP
jgi:hypothetical protein